jgi:hypothetical protein
VQIGDPAHRKSRKIGDCDAFSPRQGKAKRLWSQVGRQREARGHGL